MNRLLTPFSDYAAETGVVLVSGLLKGQSEALGTRFNPQVPLRVPGQHYTSKSRQNGEHCQILKMI